MVCRLPNNARFGIGLCFWSIREQTLGWGLIFAKPRPKKSFKDLCSRKIKISRGRNIVDDKKKKLSSNKLGLVGNFVLFLPPSPSFCSFLRQNVIGLARVPWFWGLNSRLMSSGIYSQESISWYSSVITELPHCWAMRVWSEWDKSIWIDLWFNWVFCCIYHNRRLPYLSR